MTRERCSSVFAGPAASGRASPWAKSLRGCACLLRSCPVQSKAPASSAGWLASSPVCTSCDQGTWHSQGQAACARRSAPSQSPSLAWLRGSLSLLCQERKKSCALASQPSCSQEPLGTWPREPCLGSKRAWSKGKRERTCSQGPGCAVPAASVAALMGAACLQVQRAGAFGFEQDVSGWRGSSASAGLLKGCEAAGAQAKSAKESRQLSVT